MPQSNTQQSRGSKTCKACNRCYVSGAEVDCPYCGTAYLDVGDKVTARGHEGTIEKIGEFMNKPAAWVFMGMLTNLDGSNPQRLIEIIDLEDLRLA